MTTEGNGSKLMIVTSDAWESRVVMKLPKLCLRLRLHVASMSPFFVQFENGLNAALWHCLHMMSKRSKVPLTKTVTLTLRVNKPLWGFRRG